MYVIQYFVRGNGLNRRDAWYPCCVGGVPKRYAALSEAQVAFDKLRIKDGYRIAEEYTVIRYKPVKVK